MSVVRVALFVLALLAGALSAGFFYTFSILIMPALATADAGTAILAMQKINLSVRTPLFAFAFFGAPALALLTAAAAGAAGHRRAAWLALASGLLQAGAVFAVTMVVNVPLNEALALVAASGPTAATTWAGYDARWTPWNHVRALGAAASFLFLLAAFASDVVAAQTRP
ncbi:MAG TPA: anthrone oxygenase family protein [Reyranella sp.]|nr:anthrone oxygenase family protein [Reyranella sp.]